ncbi:hypothetical protein ABW16_01685 [Mycolicibacter heraklionensis]|uniref:Uncharacterized protein n=1 Tax=Mycolicibacter heraklionensis TaxID=512402 RepID=A0ABR5FL01_9MYCO|nr:hypothetical protein [Mycolicibacter heraklionensis]KLO31574.1 hypothetical protein ABW16_01685 [Mycolicibacter heraklionensis]
MTITNTVPGGFLQSLAAKQINLSSDTLKVILLDNGYTFSDSHRYQSDLGAHEIPNGNGYTTGGQALTNQAVSYASKTLSLTADNPVWNDSTITAYKAAVVDTTPGTAAANPILTVIDFGGAESDTNGTFQITWNDGVVLTISHP